MTSGSLDPGSQHLIWPPIAKYGGKTWAFVAAIFFVVSESVWLWVFSAKGWELWYDTPVEFLFFAAGVIISLATHGKSTHDMNGLIRGGVLIAGLFSLVVAARVGRIGIDNVQGLTSTRLYIGYSVALSGCALIFAAILLCPTAMPSNS